MPELLGVRAAANALQLNPSTISRYLKEFPDLNQGSRKRPKIDVDELRHHRAGNTDPTPRGHQAAKEIADAVPEAQPGAPNYLMAKAVRETVLAQRARLDLDEKRGLLVPRAEIEDAVFEAGLLLQRNLLHLCSQVAERLASMSDARQITELLEAEHRKVLAQVAAALRAKAGSLQAEDKARDATD